MIKFFRKIRQNMIVKNKLSNYLLYAIGEILLIAIGIFMALQLQNWNDSKKTAEASNEMLTRIKKEILSNQEQISNVYDYHIMVRDTLKVIQTPKNETEASQAFKFWRGLRIFRLRDAAFQTSIQSGISKDLDANLMESLNDLYTLQEAYNDYGKTAGQALYNKDFTNLENFPGIATFLNMVMVDLYYSESELKESFNKSLQEINDHIN